MVWKRSLGVGTMSLLTGVAIATMTGSPEAAAFSLTKAMHASVEFRVSSVDSNPVSGARVVIIDKDGKIAANGRTDGMGVYTVTLRTVQDGRFTSIQDIGTVTALVFATGYNEDIVTDVPVGIDKVQPIRLLPIRAPLRNEPTWSLGNINRHTLQQMLDKYAEQVGLKRQPPAPGEILGPWSPETGGVKR